MKCSRTRTTHDANNKPSSSWTALSKNDYTIPWIYFPGHNRFRQFSKHGIRVTDSKCNLSWTRSEPRSLQIMSRDVHDACRFLRVLAQGRHAHFINGTIYGRRMSVRSSHETMRLTISTRRIHSVSLMRERVEIREIWVYRRLTSVSCRTDHGSEGLHACVCRGVIRAIRVRNELVCECVCLYLYHYFWTWDSWDLYFFPVTHISAHISYVYQFRRIIK